jgi:hypothetical protein
LIRQLSQANPLWGAPRIHGELLKLGIRIGQTAVAKYMARRPRAPSPSWRTFFKQHVEAIAAIDMFIVVSATFQMLICRRAGARSQDRNSSRPTAVGRGRSSKITSRRAHRQCGILYR